MMFFLRFSFRISTTNKTNKQKKSKIARVASFFFLAESVLLFFIFSGCFISCNIEVEFAEYCRESKKNNVQKINERDNNTKKKMSVLFSVMFVIEELERSARLQVVEHQIDGFESLLDVFCAGAKIIVANNSMRSLMHKHHALQNQLDATRERSAQLTVLIEREATSRTAAERSNETALQMFEFWRRKASEQAQEMKEISEAQQLAKESAIFWKARCLCAEGALRHLTNEEFDMRIDTRK